ncbi:hypothetical protein TNCV_3371401 [Trichonephila clavipes]|nr:hypothetical protein TNCV_3371401 [Trichonephila clavipes]
MLKLTERPGEFLWEADKGAPFQPWCSPDDPYIDDEHKKMAASESRRKEGFCGSSRFPNAVFKAFQKVIHRYFEVSRRTGKENRAIFRNFPQ